MLVSETKSFKSPTNEETMDIPFDVKTYHDPLTNLGCESELAKVDYGLKIWSRTTSIHDSVVTNDAYCVQSFTGLSEEKRKWQ